MRVIPSSEARDLLAERCKHHDFGEESLRHMHIQLLSGWDVPFTKDSWLLLLCVCVCVLVVGGCKKTLKVNVSSETVNENDFTPIRCETQA